MEVKRLDKLNIHAVRWSNYAVSFFNHRHLIIIKLLT